MEPIVNKKAYFDYEIMDTLEAGIVLLGSEVKSLRAGKANIAGSYAKIYGNEAWLVHATIAPYQEQNTPKEYDPMRSRKLLLKSDEIASLIGKTKEKGYTLVPLRIFGNKGKIKIELALCRSKTKQDKREKIRERETKRAMRRLSA